MLTSAPARRPRRLPRLPRPSEPPRPVFRTPRAGSAPSPEPRAAGRSRRAAPGRTRRAPRGCPREPGVRPGDRGDQVGARTIHQDRAWCEPMQSVTADHARGLAGQRQVRGEQHDVARRHPAHQLVAVGDIVGDPELAEREPGPQVTGPEHGGQALVDAGVDDPYAPNLAGSCDGQVSRPVRPRSLRVGHGPAVVEVVADEPPGRRVLRGERVPVPRHGGSDLERELLAQLHAPLVE